MPQTEIHSHNYSGRLKYQLKLCYTQSDLQSAIRRDSIQMRTQAYVRAHFT